MGDLTPPHIRSVQWAAVVRACLGTSVPSAGESSQVLPWEITPPLLPGPGVVPTGEKWSCDPGWVAQDPFKTQIRTVWKGRLACFWVNCWACRGWEPGGSCQDHPRRAPAWAGSRCRRAEERLLHTSLSLGPTMSEAGRHPDLSASKTMCKFLLHL